jgi:WD40 repeat protein
MWDVATGENLRTFSGNMGQVQSVAFSPDGKRIVSNADTLKVWDAASGEETLTLKGGGGLAAFSADGKKIVSSSDFVVKVWDATLKAP